MNKGLSATSVVTVSIVILLLSASLLYIGFDYPSGNMGSGRGRLFDLFHKQFYDRNGLGRNFTVFRTSVSSHAYLVGYVRTNSNSTIGNSKMFAAVYPMETDAVTNATGYYSILVLYRGTGTFAFIIQNYTMLVRNVTLRGSTNWLNLTFTPYGLNNVSGTIKSSTGISILHASIAFDDFISNTTVFSNVSGDFSVYLPDGNYTIFASAPFYKNASENITFVGVGLHSISMILQNAANNASFTVNGTVRTTSGLPVSGAYVKCGPFNNITTTNSQGNFTIRGIFGYVAFIVNASAYVTNRTPPLLVRYSIPLIIVNVEPVASIGAAISLLNASSWNTTDIAFYNYSMLAKKLGTIGHTGPFSSAGSVINVRLLNRTGSISDAGYLLYVIANGVLYSGTNHYRQVTNHTGWLTVQLLYSGPLSVLIKLPYYNAYVFNGTSGGTTWINITLTPVQLYATTVNGTDSYNTTATIGRPSILNFMVAGSLDFNTTKMSNYTTTTFLLPNGTYEFCTNPFNYIGGTWEWVNIVLTLHVAGAPVSGWLHYREYMILIHDTSIYPLFDHIAVKSGSYSVSTMGKVFAGRWLNLSGPFGFGAGNYSYFLSLGNGSYNTSGMFVLNVTHPAYIINFSGQNNVTNVTSSNNNMNYSVSSNGTMRVNFSISVAAGTLPELLTNLDIQGLNFTLNNSRIYIGADVIAFSGNSVNLTTFVRLNGMQSATLSFTNLTKWQELEIMSTMYLRLHYVVPTFVSNYIYD